MEYSRREIVAAGAAAGLLVLPGCSTLPGLSLTEAIKLERTLMESVADACDLLIDTSLLTAAQLRQKIWKQVSEHSNDNISILLESFAFKRGVPYDADFVFDARCLPNPYWQHELRALTGQDQAVKDFLGEQKMVNEYLNDLCHFAKKWINQFEANDRSYITIAIGCTGGQHRSVFMTELLAEYFRTQRSKVTVRHRELDQNGH